VTGECDPHVSYGFGAQAVLLEVDEETGETDLIKLWAANNVGKAINPAMVYGQSAGGAVMGLGYALCEEIIHQDAKLRTRRFSEYHVPTALDIPPEFVDIQVEKADPTGPYGATGLGETPLMPTVPVVLGAIADAVGVQLNSIPATAERVWQALQDKN
jgi:CO/xanthine dehydrogenase Mo-binding subunit